MYVVRSLMLFVNSLGPCGNHGTLGELNENATILKYGGVIPCIPVTLM